MLLNQPRQASNRAMQRTGVTARILAFDDFYFNLQPNMPLNSGQ